MGAGVRCIFWVVFSQKITANGGCDTFLLVKEAVCLNNFNENQMGSFVARKQLFGLCTLMPGWMTSQFTYCKEIKLNHCDEAKKRM